MLSNNRTAIPIVKKDYDLWLFKKAAHGYLTFACVNPHSKFYSIKTQLSCLLLRHILNRNIARKFDPLLTTKTKFRKFRTKSHKVIAKFRKPWAKSRRRWAKFRSIFRIGVIWSLRNFERKFARFRVRTKPETKRNLATFLLSTTVYSLLQLDFSLQFSRFGCI